MFSFFLFSLFFYSSTFFYHQLCFFFTILFFTVFGEKLLCIVLYWEIYNIYIKYWVNPILRNIVNPIQYPIRIARPCLQLGMGKELTTSILEDGIATSICTTKWKRKRKWWNRFHIPTCNATLTCSAALYACFLLASLAHYIHRLAHLLSFLNPSWDGWNSWMYVFALRILLYEQLGFFVFKT